MTDNPKVLQWIRVADIDELPPGRVKTVTAGTHSRDIQGQGPNPGSPSVSSRSIRPVGYTGSQLVYE